MGEIEGGERLIQLSFEVFGRKSVKMTGTGDGGLKADKVREVVWVFGASDGDATLGAGVEAVASGLGKIGDELVFRGRKIQKHGMGRDEIEDFFGICAN